MKVQFEISDHLYSIDLENPFDISIPMIFNGDQPNTYDVPIATARAYADGNFIGDTRKGGSCNFEEYKLIPHCNGTHTECVGHIAYERISIHSVLRDSFIPATLISVQPVKASDTHELCRPEKKGEDLLLTKRAIKQALQSLSSSFFAGLIIRTLPNDESKKSKKYGMLPPPYFTIDAVQFIIEMNVQHLLVDVPSVDRTLDEGKMTVHHIFWNVPEESHEVSPHNHSLKTITEMIYVPGQASDGAYLLNLQIASFVADAAPSRPIVYEIHSL